MTETFLERIVAATREVIAERRAAVPLAELRARVADAPAPRDFAAALRPAAGGSARLIAEVKRASPSKGVITEAFEPVAQAQAYERGGAAAISVLTEPAFFLGSPEHLRAARAAVELPVLRKDFTIDPYQLYEARAMGADAVLLILSLLDDARLRDYLALARGLGMEALVEAHDAQEARRAVAAGATVIGVNSRDLRTFTVDSEIVRHLRPLVPADRVFVAESGIADALGATRARAWGADAILAGETLMRAADPAARARELATAAGGETARLLGGGSAPFVKICGLTQPEHVRLVAERGGDAFGLVFAPMAPAHRRVSVEQARALAQAATIPAVGVFVNAPVEQIAQIAATVGLGAIQLSGDETPEQARAIHARTGLPVIKALRLRDEDDLAPLDAYALAAATLLLDAPQSGGGYGGGGVAGDWGLAGRAAQRWPLLLAGGLTPENVAQALEATGARGVDVSSGVETAAAKDSAKIAAFIAAAKSVRNARVTQAALHAHSTSQPEKPIETSV